jgi:hypothetical protein
MNQAFQALWSCRLQRTKLAIAALALTTTAVSLLSVALMFPPAGRADSGDEFEAFTVDVTQDVNKSAQNNVDPSKGCEISGCAQPNSLSRGDTFIVDGALYPSHTLQNGVADVPPSAHSIGNYRVRGTALISGDDFIRAVAGDTTAPRLMFFATEEFSFPDDETSIITEGVWPNARRSAHRVVVGGTGRFRNVVGEAYIENIGEGTNGFCNSRVRFKLRKALAGHDR